MKVGAVIASALALVASGLAGSAIVGSDTNNAPTVQESTNAGSSRQAEQQANTEATRQAVRQRIAEPVSGGGAGKPVSRYVSSSYRKWHNAPGSGGCNKIKRSRRARRKRKR